MFRLDATEARDVTEGSSPSSPSDRSTEFVAVDPRAGGRYDGPTLVVVAYAAIWLIVMGFLVSMWRKQTALRARLDGLERAIDRAAAGSDPKAG